MKLLLCVVAGAAVAISAPAFAHGGAGGFSPMSRGTITIPAGHTVGPQTVNSNTTSTLTNNGTIQGGSQPGVTVTGSQPSTVVNNGTITSNTTGVQVTGGSSTVVNDGTISVTSSSTGGTATATGVSETSGP